jgi:hypothetical protein
MNGGLMSQLRVAPTPAASSWGQNRPKATGQGWYWTPRVEGPQDYPFDFDGSERHMRPRRGWDIFTVTPWRQMLADGGAAVMGWVWPLMPFGDAAVLAAAVGRMPSGPTIGVTADGSLILSPVWTADGLGAPMDIESVVLTGIPKQLG